MAAPGNVTIPVYFMDESFEEFSVPRYITALELRDIVAKKKGVPPSIFNIFAMSGVRNLLSLELQPNQYPVDFLDKEEFTRLLKQLCEKKKRKKTPDWYECKLTFKTRALIPLSTLRNAEDLNVISMFYMEAVAEVMHGRYLTITTDTAVELAALALQAAEGDFKKKLHKPQYIAGILKDYFSRSELRLKDKNNLVDRLIAAHKKLKGNTRSTSMAAYLEIVWRYSTYGAAYFECIVKAHTGNKIARESNAVLALCDERIFILLPRREPIQFTHVDVLDWEYTDTELSLVYVDDKGNDNSVQFFSKKGCLVADYLQAAYAYKQRQLAGEQLETVPAGIADPL